MNSKSIALATIVIAIVSVASNAQVRTNVKSVNGQTENNLVFTISARRTRIPMSRELIIDFKVVNESRKTVHLMMNRIPQIVVTGYELRIAKVHPTVGSMPLSDWVFRSIRPAGSVRGEIHVPKNTIQEPTIWSAIVGFVFVFDNKEFYRQISRTEDPARLIGEFTFQANSIELGTLDITFEK